LFCGTLWMVFHIFGLSGLEQVAFFHNLGQMKEALPLNSLFNYFETTPFQTVDKAMRKDFDAHGGDCEAGRVCPLHVQSCKNGNFLGSFHFCFQAVDTLSTA
ncbi:MAG: hypothetical protein IKH34_07105, partial [Oscillospiraceae bacterium]|nr:hypothetical protein [Oscillospiraceae bacterium]